MVICKIARNWELWLLTCNLELKYLRASWRRSEGLIQTFPITLGIMSGFDCWNFCQTLKTMNGQNSYSDKIKSFQRRPCSHNNYSGFLSLPLFWAGTSVGPILCNWRTWWWWACGRGRLKGPFLTWCLLFEQIFPWWGCFYRNWWIFLGFWKKVPIWWQNFHC